MKRIFLLIAMFFGAVSATMASSVDVTYSEETELVGIVSHLADIPGHNFEEDVLPDYLSEVDSVFAGYPIDMNGYTLEDWIKMDEEDKKFVMIRDVIRVLDERERLADKYPTMRSFMPRYVETVNSFQSSR